MQFLSDNLIHTMCRTTKEGQEVAHLFKYICYHAQEPGFKPLVPMCRGKLEKW